MGEIDISEEAVRKLFAILVEPYGLDIAADTMWTLRSALTAAGAERDEALGMVAALRVALARARPLMEKWCHYQGNMESFFRATLDPIDLTLTDTAAAAREYRARMVEECAEIVKSLASGLDVGEGPKTDGYLAAVRTAHMHLTDAAAKIREGRQ